MTKRRTSTYAFFDEVSDWRSPRLTWAEVDTDITSVTRGSGPAGEGNRRVRAVNRYRLQSPTSPIEVHLELHLVHKILTSVENFRRWRCCPQDRGVSPNGASPTWH